MQQGDDVTGYPWAPGDALLASDLNAAIANNISGPFLPISGGGLTGPLTIATTAHTALSLPNGLNFVGDFQGTPWPGIEMRGNPFLFSRDPATVTSTDYLDFQFRHNTMGLAAPPSGAGQINSCLQVLTDIGPNDASDNWGLTSLVNMHGSGLNVALDVGVTRQSGTGAIIAAVVVGADATNSTLGMVSFEVDNIVQNADTGLNASMWGGIGGRVCIDIVACRAITAQTTPRTEVSIGIWFTQDIGPGGSPGDPYINYKSMIGVGANTQAYQALDTRGAIVPTGYASPFAAVRMQGGQIIDFKGGSQLNSNAGNYLQYTATGTPRLRYMVGVNEKLSVDDRGKTTITGSQGGWSNAFIDECLYVTGETFPSIAISDRNGANLRAIVNFDGVLSFSQMPAFGDNTSPPVPMLNLNMPNSQCYTRMEFQTGISFTPVPPNAANDAAAASASVPVGGVYRNGSVLMVRVA
jgi:hypothetical protein